MPRSMMRLSALGILTGAILVLAGRALAADVPLAGKWKFMDVTDGNEVSLFILTIAEKDGKPMLVNESSPLLGKDLALDDVRIDGRSVQFSFKFRGAVAKVALFAAKGDEKPKLLLGSLHIFGGVHFAELARTEEKAIDEDAAIKQSPAGKDLRKARSSRDVKEQETLLKELLEKNADKSVGYSAALLLLQLKAKEGAKEEELTALVAGMVKVAASYGPAHEPTTNLIVAQALAKGEKVSPLAVEFARKAEKALSKDDAPSHTTTVLKTLESALKKSGKTDEAKEITARIVKIEEQLDAEFEKTAVPFKPEEFKGRKGKSSRVAVVELFTGAQCPPCVSADIAFDAASKAYKPADVVLLQYHLHIPGPDPLTNADSEKRQEYYGDAVGGTPAAFVNGKVTDALGGFKQHGKERFDTLKDLINGALEADDQASLKLSLDRKGDKINVSAEVKDLKKTGEKVRLRFVLIEDVVRYQGGNGQRLHHHVVRAFPGGVDGFALKEATGKQAVTILLSDLAKTLSDYLKASNEMNPFRDDERPLNLKHLKIIALIQNDENKEILQAVQIEVPEAK